jgi:hypothetical protein
MMISATKSTKRSGFLDAQDIGISWKRHELRFETLRRRKYKYETNHPNDFLSNPSYFSPFRPTVGKMHVSDLNLPKVKDPCSFNEACSCGDQLPFAQLP